MLKIEDIKKVISAECNAFEEKFNAVFETDNPLLSSVFEHVLKGKGKQIRPMLVLLSAKLCGEVNNQAIDASIALELLHTATLIHDDVVDETYERRGNPSVNAKWDNKISILTGDYMLSNSLAVAVRTGSLQILEQISSIGKELADGELLQLSKSKKSLLSEEDYYQIIRKKTAMLFSVCTSSGAVSAKTSKDKIQSLSNFGEYLGMCFQIQDDIFDYSENKEIGKPVGNDIREGKVTLPLILALKNGVGEQKDKISAIIDNKDFTVENIEKILDFTRKNNGIELAQAKMEIYKNKAIEQLNDFEDNDVKSALLEILEYTVKRDK
jgi:octaprenyl-diphosphate synthase